MHVLLANNLYPPFVAGGAELIVVYLAQGLAAAGHQVTVVTTCGPEMEPYPDEDHDGVRVIRFFPRNMYWSFARDGQGKVNRALWHLRDAWNRDAATRFDSILQAARPDIVHTHVIDGFSGSIWRRAAKHGIPVVHTAHDYHLICPRAFLLSRDWRVCTHPTIACRTYRTWHLKTTAPVDLFVSPSQFLLDKHLEAGMPARRTAVVRNGIPVVPMPRRQRDPGAPCKFLLMCRLTQEKGVRIVLDAMRQLPAALPVELTIAGRGPLEPTARAAAESDSRIRFAGFVQGETKLALLSDADYLLIPSLWYENAPVAIVEAAAYQIGVVASRIGGIPELVREGSTGCLFEPGDVAGLAALMRNLATGQLRLTNLQQAARAVAEDHTVGRMLDGYLRHYESVLCRAGTNGTGAAAMDPAARIAEHAG